MDKKLSCVLFSMTRKKRRREGREQRCQSTETTTSIQFRTLCRSVGGSNSSDFFSLSVLATQSTEERKKKRSDRKGRCRFECIYVRIRKRKKEGR